MKSVFAKHLKRHGSVTPFAGVWIEIKAGREQLRAKVVTPFAGVWIEIIGLLFKSLILSTSLPSRECGLKYGMLRTVKKFSDVTQIA